MKRLTKRNFKKEVDKMLLTKNRWNSSLDKELCKSVLDNIDCPVYTQGISVYGRLLMVGKVPCTVQIIYNPYMVVANGWAIAGCYTDSVEQIVVFVDDDYMQLSKEAQKFVFYHEIGHIACWHSFTDASRILDYEYEADAYAVSKCCNVDAVQVLTELLSYAPQAKEEIQKRIFKLQ